MRTTLAVEDVSEGPVINLKGNVDAGDDKQPGGLGEIAGAFVEAHVAHPVTLVEVPESVLKDRVGIGIYPRRVGAWSVHHAEDLNKEEKNEVKNPTSARFHPYWRTPSGVPVAFAGGHLVRFCSAAKHESSPRIEDPPSEYE